MSSRDIAYQIPSHNGSKDFFFAFEVAQASSFPSLEYYCEESKKKEWSEQNELNRDREDARSLKG